MGCIHRILIIGASGNVGRHVLSQLPADGSHVRALTRNPETVSLPSHVQAVQADLTRPETLDASLEGIDTVFLVWTAPPIAIDAALESIAKHARRIVFLSSPLRTSHPFFQQPNPLRDAALRIERLIEASGLEWTFLRPGMFAGNAIHWWAPQIRAGDLVSWPCLAAPTAPIDERDIASIAVRALLEDGHAGADYVLTGPQSLTQFEQLSTIARAIARPLRIAEISAEEARQTVFQRWPPAVANMLLAAWAAALGQPAFVSSTLEEITGTPPRTFFDWSIDNKEAFRR